MRQSFPSRVLPNAVWRPLRSIATAVLTPLRFSVVSGHARSAFARAALSRTGEALPWYTYPAIDFLSQRNFAGKSVLEFGGGQSTLWWAARAERVLTIEEDEAWYGRLKMSISHNVDLHYVPADVTTRSIASIRTLLDSVRDAAGGLRTFDVIVIDGHLRGELAAAAFDYLAPGGALILDNAEGYGFWEATRGRICRRIDFFGFAPGVWRRHCTALVFVDDCFLLDPRIPIARIEDPPEGS